VAILDRVVEDRREARDQLADRCRSERDAAPVALVTHVGTGRDVAPQVARLSHLLGFERETQLSVDFVEPALSEEWEEVALQTPEVVRARVRAERSIAEHAVSTPVKPFGGVLVEGRHLGRLGRHTADMVLLAFPDPGPHTRLDGPELATDCAFVPPAATSALAGSPLVQGHCFPIAIGHEPQLEGTRSVRQVPDPDPAARYRAAAHARHSFVGVA
jgi:hypothetical protein